MWGFGGNKGEYSPEPKVSKYKEGQVVYQPGDYPTIPKIIYRIMEDGSIFAAEFLVTEDDILFVKNVMLEERQIALTDPDTHTEAYLRENWEHYGQTGQFIKRKTKHVAAKASQAVTFHNVVCAMSSGEEYKWYKLSEEQARQLYRDLRRARVEKSIWESTVGPRSQFIVGEFISSVHIVPYGT